MKVKIRILLIFLITISSVLGCLAKNEIRNNKIERDALVTQACCDGFGVSSIGSGLSQYVEVFDTDIYGRKLYSFNNSRYSFDWEGQKKTWMFLICQKITSSYVYYYPGEKFLLNRGDRMMLSSQEIQWFKEANDWNKPINIKKCVSKEIGENLYSNDSQKRRQDIIKNLLPNESSTNISYCRYCDTDKNGQELYAVKMKNKPYNYAFIFKNKFSNSKYSITKINSSYYQDEITAFKKANNWQYDYCID